MRALVVGGTGPTGPHIVGGLRERGYEVVILHRGTHELPELDDYEHIHADPHFQQTLEQGLQGRTFDLAIATYGRIRHVAQALAGKVDRFMSMSSFSVYRGFEYRNSENPSSWQVPTGEDREVVKDESEHKFSYLISSTEASVFELHPNATIFRYPAIYGPRQPMPSAWSLVGRILDKRRHIILLNGGLAINSAMHAENAAHGVLLAVDHKEASAGQAYNMADTRQLTYREILEIVCQELDYSFDVCSLPDVGDVRKVAYGGLRHHHYLDTFRIRSELGYRDVVDPVEGVRETARWLADNPPERGSAQERSVDAFDYATEDDLINLWQPMRARLEQVAATGKELVMHAYAHPKAPGAVDQQGR